MHDWQLKYTFNNKLQNYGSLVNSLLKSRVATECKLKRYKELNYEVTSSYECEFKEKIKEFPEIVNHV